MGRNSVADNKPLDNIGEGYLMADHNRQLHKNIILKGGIRKNNQAAYEVKGFRLFDTVRYNGKTYIVFGHRTSGFMDIRTLSGDKVNNGSISFKKLKLVAYNNNFIVERRIAG